MPGSKTFIFILLASISGIANSQPSQQSTNIVFSAIGTNELTLSWTIGNGNGRILVAKEGSPVDVTPLSTDSYAPNSSFGDPASELRLTKNYVIADLTGTNNTTSVTNLKPATTYHFQVFEYNDLLEIRTYNTDPATYNPASQITLALEPSTQASSISFSSLSSSSMVVTWTNGSGSERLVIASDDGSVSSNPQDGISYTGNSDFGLATDLGSNDKIVYRGTGNSVPVTGLSPSTQYAFKIFELNGTGAASNYNTADNTNNPLARYTLANEPEAHAASFTATSGGTNAITLDFSAANTITNATGYIILRREDGSDPDATGINDAQTVSSSPEAGTTRIATITNTSSSVYQDTALAAQTRYSYVIIPYNFDGSNPETYNYRTASQLPTAATFTLSAEPASHPDSFAAAENETSEVELSFPAANSIANAAGYIILRRSDGTDPDVSGITDGSAIGATPATGTVLATVITSTAATAFTDTNLQPGTPYNYAIIPFGYDGTNAGTYNYRTSGSPLTSSAVTLTDAPALHAVEAISNSGFTASWNAVTNASSYSIDVSTSNDFSTFVGTYNDMLIGAGASYAVSGLAPGIRYYYRVRSNNSVGAASADSQVGSVITLPADPTALDATDITTTSLVARWNAVDGADNYLLEVSQDNFLTFLPGYGPKTIEPAETSEAVSGLTAGTVYRYRLRAVNASGVSENSNVISQVTIPLKPGKPVVVDVTESNFLGEWEASPGADHYEVDISQDENFSTFVAGYEGKALTKTEIVATGLTAGGVFYFRVRAVNTGGKSEISEATTVLLDGYEASPLLVTVTDFNNGVFSVGSASIDISGQVTNDPKIKVSKVELLYKGITETAFRSTPVSFSSNSYQITIPAEQLDDLGLEFNVKVVDAADRTAETGVKMIYKNFSSANSPVFINRKFSGKYKDYRIVAMPYMLKNNSIEALFEKLGQYDPRAWRFGHYQDGKTLETRKGILTIERGLGYWFNAKYNDVLRLQTGEGEVAKNHAGEPFKLSLSQGWNQIGNPYPFAVNWDDVRDANPGISGIGNLYQWESGAYREQNLLSPYTGAFVYAEEAATSLIFPVTLRTSSGGRTGSNGRTISAADIGKESWHIRLKVNTGQARYEVGGFGMHPEASLSKDAFDAVALPKFFEYVDVNFPHPESRFAAFSRDIVPTDQEFKWSFAVETNLKDSESTLSWDNSRFGENDAQLYLLHVNTGALINMRSESAYTFKTQGGKENFNIYFTRENKEFSPEVLVIGKPYPNPSRETVSFNVVLPEANDRYHVEMTAYDPLGRPVKQILNSIMPGGVHRVVWNADRDDGHKVSPGLYLLRAVVNGKSINRAERVWMLK
jgi:hypothetical protein